MTKSFSNIFTGPSQFHLPKGRIQADLTFCLSKGYSPWDWPWRKLTCWKLLLYVHAGTWLYWGTCTRAHWQILSDSSCKHQLERTPRNWDHLDTDKVHNLISIAAQKKSKSMNLKMVFFPVLDSRKVKSGLLALNHRVHNERTVQGDHNRVSLWTLNHLEWTSKQNRSYWT